jgi:hypothetical protein
MNRVWYIGGWGFVAVCATVLFRAQRPELYVFQEPDIPFPVAALGSGAAAWFESVKPHCNALEVELRLQSSPPPRGWEGAGFGAACWAVAGRIERARAAIAALPAHERDRAAGIVFGIGHPIADMGDDRSAGPIMQLVVEFQPWNYMALYHAGMSYYAIGQPAEAGRHLTAFLEQYSPEDGWRANAIEVLGRLRKDGRP